MSISSCNSLLAIHSERYKVFVDLFNLSNFFVPFQRMPPLSSSIEQGVADNDLINNNDKAFCSDNGGEGHVSAVTSKINNVAITTTATADSNWRRNAFDSCELNSMQ